MSETKKGETKVIPVSQQPRPEREGAENYLFNQYWSFDDLEMHPRWKDAIQNNDKVLLEEILYENGADTKYGWEIVQGPCSSRIKQRPTMGPRISFKERTDKEHMKEYMSIEDVILHTTDEQTRVDMIGVLNSNMSLHTASEEAMSLYSETNTKVKEKKGDVIILSDEEFDSFVDSLEVDKHSESPLANLRARVNRREDGLDEGDEA